MELYSSNPPHMAPKRFADIAPDISPLPVKRVENTMPEKNRGQVSKPSVANRPVQVEGSPPLRATHQPTISDATSNAYGTTGLLISKRCTIRLARYAITRIPAMTNPITCHELPNVSPSSVMLLVSTSMKPAPSRKKGTLPGCGRPGRKL